MKSRRILGKFVWFSAIFLIAGIVCSSLHGGHVAIDIFSEKLPEKWCHWLAITCMVLLTGVFALAMIVAGTPMAIDSWLAGEEGHSVWRPPLAHFRTVIPVAFLFIFLQGGSNIIKHAAALKGVKI